MKTTILTAFAALCMLGTTTLGAQSWTLSECIEYARKNNIQVQSAQLSVQSSTEDLAQAKSALYPSLGFSSSQNFSASKQDVDQSGSFTSSASYNGSYALSSSVTLYNGGKLRNTVRQAEIENKAGEYDTGAAQNSIEIAVTQAYLNILYAAESVKTAERSVELSNAQVDRGTQLLAAGSISKSDLAQLQSQLSSDRYQLVTSQNSLATAKLSLKQLLELGIDAQFDVTFPEIDDSVVLDEVPDLTDVYQTAVESQPDMESSRLNVELAKINERIAASSSLPTISASAAIGTGNISGSNYSFYNQLNNQLNENVGISISVPIFNNRSARTARNKARLQTAQAQLSYQSAEKELLSTVESLRQDAISSQSRYRAAQEQLRSAENSYELIVEKFALNMLNTVELMSGKNSYNDAQQELTQAKFEAVLSLQLLNFYCNKPIEL